MRVTTYGVRRIEAAGGDVTVEKERMRGHFAVRFGDDRSEDEKTLARSSTVRKAFNSPFRPFVLATTSVGQEGLDFHRYCHAVVHWNLPSNPVDMEQREGRVHRYKGHAVRKNVAARHRAVAFRDGDDPWEELFAEAAAQRAEDESELVPYWVYPGGAKIERYVPALPLSRDARQLERLKRSMAAYRLVFGQPRQEDLVAFLSERLDADTLAGMLDSLRIDVTPAPLPAGRRRELVDLPRIAVPARGAQERRGSGGGAGDDGGGARGRSLTPRQEQYVRFWDALLVEIKQRFPGWTDKNPHATSWISLPGGISRVHFGIVFADRVRLRIELYVDPVDDVLRRWVWEQLQAARERIEARFGGPLTWEELPGRRASRIACYYEAGPASVDREAEWSAYRTWILEQLPRFRAALQPEVDALRDELLG